MNREEKRLFIRELDNLQYKINSLNGIPLVREIIRDLETKNIEYVKEKIYNKQAYLSKYPKLYKFLDEKLELELPEYIYLY